MVNKQSVIAVSLGVLFASSAAAQTGAVVHEAAPQEAAVPAATAQRASATSAAPSSVPVIDEGALARVSPDERYKFAKAWVSFASDYRRTAGLFRPIAFAESAPQRYPRPLLKLKTEYVPGTTEAAFLPTDGSGFAKINDEHLSLNSGAVIVRASQKPVFVSQTISGEKVMTRIARGAVVMVSNFDGHSTVLNLGESCCGALMSYVPAADGKGLSAVSVPAGQILEVLPTAAPASIEKLALNIAVDKVCSNKVRMLQAHCDYPLALKRYNLLPMLDVIYPPPPPPMKPASTSTAAENTVVRPSR